ncbi:hypothetical protein GPROT1_00884 [Gammaproteobacteria bacterium]|nr:hypothetical protein GPROT1_00884 [Gammaproteobacteria bacterium]
MKVLRLIGTAVQSKIAQIEVALTSAQLEEKKKQLKELQFSN